MPASPELTDTQLRELVERFYARVRQDPNLGPIFNDVIHDWPEHLTKLTDFWSSVMLTTGRYHGNPMQVHFRQKYRLTPALFERWLELWRETSTETLPPAYAAAIQAKAARMAENLQRGCGLLPANW
ncbi:group III truncated hemoglobin [Acidocella aromatica]|uniref:Hemoglobin n=1 Tax=Acidocella aromatica TaxID=1303579 RepID=A0A840VC47_9PROT|nr:group III truncated hemoglobin [Acidocella aromatica]MBB5373478.1 hemoglobin [Acidocella aromatica]